MTMTMAVQGRALRKEPRGCRGKRSARGPAEAGKQGWSRVRSLCVCPRVSEDEPPSAAGMNPGRGGTRCGGSGQLAEPPARDGGNWGGRPEAGQSCPGLSLAQSRWLPRSALAVTALRPLAHDPSL